jgi:hypothetical protein
MKSSWPIEQDVLAGQAKLIQAGKKSPLEWRADAVFSLVAFA